MIFKYYLQNYTYERTRTEQTSVARLWICPVLRLNTTRTRSMEYTLTLNLGRPIHFKWIMLRSSVSLNTIRRCMEWSDFHHWHLSNEKPWSSWVQISAQWQENTKQHRQALPSVWQCKCVNFWMDTRFRHIYIEKHRLICTYSEVCVPCDFWSHHTV